MQGLKEEVLATYAAYIDAFRANDVAALDRLMQYPFAFIGNGRVALVESFPIKPADLMAAKQWRDTNDLNPEVVFLIRKGACDRASRHPGQGRRFTYRGCLSVLRADPRTIRLEVLRPL